MNAQVKPIVEDFLSRRLAKLGKTEAVLLTTAVFDDGLLDSLALVDLITELEKQIGREADVLLFDPSEINTVEDLIGQMEQVFAA
jgi:acyl carrier protein